MDVITVVKQNPFLVPMAVVAAAAMLFISEGSYWNSVEALDELGEMAAARTTIQRLERSHLYAETGQRGYLLTDRRDYLKPYDEALTSVAQSFEFLDRHYVKEPVPNELVVRLHALSQTKLSELALTIKLHEQGRSEATKELVLSDIGREKMEGIRLLSAELLEYETQKVAKGRKDVYATLMLSRIGVAALTAVMLLALVLYFRKSHALVLQQLEQKRLVQAERDRLEIEVGHRTAQLTQLNQHLLTAREDERNRLARDLHDELGALLTAAKLDAARIKSRLGSTAPEALARLGDLVSKLDGGIALGRRIIEDLRPSTLGHLGLVATLEILAGEFAARSGIKVDCALEPVRLGPAAELVMYRVVQETITNITKYAHAKQVWLSVAQRGGRAEVAVRDDGVGFDPSARPTSAYGLVGMRFRVEAEGGTMTVVSSHGQGTTVRVTLPQEDQPAG